MCEKMSTFAAKFAAMELTNIATFVTDKISSRDIKLQDYVTTDSLLPNKQGRAEAQNLPPQPCTLTKYRAGDVLVANIRPYLQKIWLADSDGGASADVLVFRAKDGHSSQYLYSVLLQDSFYEWVMLGTKGSQMPRGNKDQIMRFSVADIGSQEKQVGALIENISNKINLNKQINRNLEALIATITDNLFLSKKDDLPMRRLGDIADITAGGDCPDVFSKERTHKCSIPIYSNGVENEGLYGYTSKATINKRSITVAARGTIGYCYRREGGYVPIIRLLSLCPKHEGGDTYLHQIISRMTFRKNGSVQQQLTVPEISSIRIPYPSEKELINYEHITRPLVEHINRNKLETATLIMQRNELLPLLINGLVNSDLSAY